MIEYMCDKCGEALLYCACAGNPLNTLSPQAELAAARQQIDRLVRKRDAAREAASKLDAQADRLALLKRAKDAERERDAVIHRCCQLGEELINAVGRGEAARIAATQRPRPSREELAKTLLVATWRGRPSLCDWGDLSTEGQGDYLAMADAVLAAIDGTPKAKEHTDG